MKHKAPISVEPIIFANIPPVRLAYLFGSSVRKTAKEPADVDIAVLLETGLDPQTMLDIRTDLMFKIAKQLGRDVDVVLLNRAGVVLRHQVVKYGKLLYAREKNLSCAYQMATLRDYEDYLPMQRFYTKVMDKRLGV